MLFSSPLAAKPELRSIVTEVFEGVLESRVKCGSCKKVCSVTAGVIEDNSYIRGPREGETILSGS